MKEDRRVEKKEESRKYEGRKMKIEEEERVRETEKQLRFEKMNIVGEKQTQQQGEECRRY